MGIDYQIKQHINLDGVRKKFEIQLEQHPDWLRPTNKIILQLERYCIRTKQRYTITFTVTGKLYQNSVIRFCRKKVNQAIKSEIRESCSVLNSYFTVMYLAWYIEGPEGLEPVQDVQYLI